MTTPQDEQNIPLSQIKADFTDQTEPQDDRLIELLKRAYTQQIVCRQATISLGNITPYSDYRPTISEAFRKHFQQTLEAGQPMSLLVYEQDGHFVMGDDYSAYSLYKEAGITSVPCTILDPGDAALKLLDISEPFYLELPTAEIIDHTTE